MAKRKKINIYNNSTSDLIAASLKRTPNCFDCFLVIDFHYAKHNIKSNWKNQKANFWLNIDGTITRYLPKDGWFSRLDDTMYLLYSKHMNQEKTFQDICVLMRDFLLRYFMHVESAHIIIYKIIDIKNDALELELKSNEVIDEIIQCKKYQKQDTCGSIYIEFEIEAMLDVQSNSEVAKRLCAKVFSTATKTEMKDEGIRKFTEDLINYINTCCLEECHKFIQQTQNESIAIMLPIQLLPGFSDSSIYNIIRGLLQISQKYRNKIMVEICNVNTEFTQEKITEIVSVIRPFVADVFVKIKMTASIFELLKNVNCTGTTIDKSSFGDDESKVMAGILGYGELSGYIAQHSVIGTFDSEHWFEFCDMAGIKSIILKQEREVRSKSSAESTDNYRLIYVSASALPSKCDIQKELKKIRKAANDNNNKLGILAALIYCDGNFIQILEGERNSVKELYRKISKDSRHKNLDMIEFCKAEEQFLDSADMPTVQLARNDSKVIEIIGEEDSINELDEDKAIDLFKLVVGK